MIIEALTSDIEELKSDLKTVVTSLDNVLDDIFDMNGSVNKEANELVEKMKKKYGFDKKEGE